MDRVWFATIIVGVGILLTIWFRFTRFGLATRAAAESEKGALVTGLSPERVDNLHSLLLGLENCHSGATCRHVARHAP